MFLPDVTEIPSECLLGVAVLQQAVVDLQSINRDVRQDAERFCRNKTLVSLWAELAHADPDEVWQKMCAVVAQHHAQM